MVGLVLCYRGNIVSAEYAILSIPTVSNITKKMSDSDIRHLWQWTILMVGLVLCYRGNVVSAECS